MPQPHITDETYKGLTPDEQATYGEAQHQKEISEGEWVAVSAKESFIWSGPTRIVHYLKPVEAQQSEGDVIKQKANDIFGKEPSGPKLHWTIGFQDGSEWRAEQYTARITALQQEVERLKEAQRWIPVSERLPPDDEQVEVMTKTVGADIATLLYESYDNTYEWDKYEWSHISHWRFLPEPPTK